MNDSLARASDLIVNVCTTKNKVAYIEDKRARKREHLVVSENPPFSIPQHEGLADSSINIPNNTDINSNQEVSPMTNDEFLNKYIEKLDRDQSDLRTDIRESERRSNERSKAVEDRMDNRLDRIEDMISKQTENVDRKIDEMGKKIDGSMGWITGVCVATILGIAAIAVSVWLK